MMPLPPYSLTIAAASRIVGMPTFVQSESWAGVRAAPVIVQVRGAPLTEFRFLLSMSRSQIWSAAATRGAMLSRISRWAAHSGPDPTAAGSPVKRWSPPSPARKAW